MNKTCSSLLLCILTVCMCLSGCGSKAEKSDSANLTGAGPASDMVSFDAVISEDSLYNAALNILKISGLYYSKKT